MTTKVLMGMPVLNRARLLPNTLKALENLNYPKSEMRLLFVEGGSTDDTARIINRFAEIHRAEYSDISLARGDFKSLPKSRNYCIEQTQQDEYLWFLDSDVMPKPEALNLLFDLAKDYDIASLYYTHDRKVDPPEFKGIRQVPAVRMGCTLISPKAVKMVGLFNEKLVNAPEDADYCIRANLAGLKIGFDEIHEQPHDMGGRMVKWYFPIADTIIKRKHRGWWFKNKIFTRRWVLYFGLFVCLLLMIYNPLFGAPILAYFLVQLSRGKKLLKAFIVTVNALLVPPTSIIAFFELHLQGTGSINSKRKETSE